MTRPTPYGALLRTRRVEAGISLRDVAEKLGVSHVYVADVERGARGPLKPEHEPALRKLIKTLTQQELDDARKKSKPIKITMESTPEKYADLTLALARRYESNTELRQTQLNQIIRILQGEDED